MFVRPKVKSYVRPWVRVVKFELHIGKLRYIKFYFYKLTPDSGQALEIFIAWVGKLRQTSE